MPESDSETLLAAVESVFPCTVKMNLVNKLAAIRRELKVIEKKGHNAHFDYDYMRAADAAGQIGDMLASSNIALTREEWTIDTAQTPKGAFLVTVQGYYVFNDGDSGEKLRTWSAGAGIDNQDKAVFKAQTGALKYALTQGLCLRVGHMDPEEDVKDDAGKQGKPTEQRAGDTPAPSGNGHAAPPKASAEHPVQRQGDDGEFGF